MDWLLVKAEVSAYWTESFSQREILAKEHLKAILGGSVLCEWILSLKASTFKTFFGKVTGRFVLESFRRRLPFELSKSSKFMNSAESSDSRQSIW